MIAIEDLTFGYEEATPIVENATIEILQGQFIGIFGPNGGGKTTFLKLLLGLLKPDRGRISIQGVSPEAARGKIGYVPQMARFDKQFPLTVLDLVLLGCLGELPWWGQIPQKYKDRAHQLLNRFGLAHLAHRPFGSLSGGQIQRALIAKALLKDPEILLLDEPTSGIDICAEKEVYDILGNLKGKITILMVTHEISSILDKADKLLCVHRHIDPFSPSQVCEHFALGLYHNHTPHTPLRRSDP